jgi:choline dehydrogenase-like flavoprotein
MLGFSYSKDYPLSPSNLSADSGAAEMAENLYNTSRTGPYIGGHNQLVGLSGPDFLSPAELQWSLRSQQNLNHLPPVYRSEPSLVAGYEAQRSIIIRQVAEHDSTLLESPIAGDSWTLLILQKPLSRGVISVNTTDPLFGEPSWDPNTLVNPADISILVSGLKAARRQQNSEAMKVLEPMEITPGTDVSSDEDLDKYVRSSVSSSIGHMSGTCAMMPRELGGVVDPKLRVYGVEKLRVVDSSIIPLIPGANIMATVYAVAERAADIIRGRKVLRDMG